MLSELVKNEIIEFLRPIDPERVILFGSYAYGTPNADSDIDLYIVTKENITPQTFEENFQVKKRVYQALTYFRKNMLPTSLFTQSLFTKDSLNGEFFFEGNNAKRNCSDLKRP